MIEYNNDGINFFAKVFRIRGSVFVHAFYVSLPCAVFACLLESSLIVSEWPQLNMVLDGIKDTAAWSGFTTLVGFLVIFRIPGAIPAIAALRDVAATLYRSACGSRQRTCRMKALQQNASLISES
jgi:hypothetical protein